MGEQIRVYPVRTWECGPLMGVGVYLLRFIYIDNPDSTTASMGIPHTLSVQQMRELAKTLQMAANRMERECKVPLTPQAWKAKKRRTN